MSEVQFRRSHTTGTGATHWCVPLKLPLRLLSGETSADMPAPKPAVQHGLPTPQHGAERLVTEKEQSDTGLTDSDAEASAVWDAEGVDVEDAVRHTVLVADPLLVTESICEGVREDERLFDQELLSESNRVDEAVSDADEARVTERVATLLVVVLDAEIVIDVVREVDEALDADRVAVALLDELHDWLIEAV